MNHTGRDVFLAALELESAAERSAYLDRIEAAEPALRREVEALLGEHEAMDGFLESPALAGEAASGARPGRGLADDAPRVTVAEGTGDQFGPYRLQEKIGEGGAGVVYLAEQTAPVRRRVAVKVLKPGMDTDVVVARFEAERQALALMEHPNIAKVLDAGATPTGRPYFVMELVRGTRITTYCDENHLATRERLALFIQVCQAIQHAHQKGVIHRDIKPSNVLVTSQDGAPVPKVIDFGIAKATEHRLTDRTVLTAFTAFIGTPAYMSPEQAEMSGLDVDTRSDVYSLGVLLYELLTGGPPFDPQTLLESGLDECRRTIREVEPARPSTRIETMVPASRTTTARRRRVEPPQLVHQLRGDLDWVVMKCLEKDRRRRYETASELALDVQRYLANEPVQARPPSRLYRCQKFVRRNRGILAAAAGIALTLIAGTAVSLWQAVRATHAERDALAAQFEEQRLRLEAERQRSAARLSEYIAHINLAQLALRAGNLGLAVQLLAKHHPEPGEPDLRGFEWRYLWQQSQGDEHVALPVHEESVQALGFSNDGLLLAIGSRRSCTVWNLRAQTVVTRLAHGALSVAFLRDGSQLVTAELGNVRVWNTRDWTEERTLPQTGAPVALAPDGAHLATVSRGNVRIWNVSDWTEARRLPEAEGPLAFAPQDGLLATGGRHGISLWSWETGEVRTRLADSARLFMIGSWWFGGGALMAFSPDGQRLVAPRNGFSERGTFVLSVWDTSSGEEIAVLPESPDRVEHAGIVTGVVIAPDGRTVATTSMDHSVRLWDLVTHRCTTTLRGHLNEVWALSLSPDGSTLASGSKDGGVNLWAVHRPTTLDRLPAGTQPLAFAADGRTLAVRSRESGVGFLDLASGEVRDEIPLPNHPFPFRLPLSLSADLGLLAEGRPDGSIRVIEVTNRTERIIENPGGRGLDWVALSPDGRSLLAGGRGQRVHWWDLSHGTREVLETEALQGVFAADGATLALLPPGRTVEVRHAATRRLRTRIKTGTEFVTTMALSADGRLLATSGVAGADHIAQVWDAATGHHLGDFLGHKQGIHALAFSPDGRTMTSCGANGTVLLWNIAGRQLLLSLEHVGGSPAGGLWFSPDGRLLIGPGSPAPDGPGFQLYRTPTLAEIEAATKE